MKMKMKIVAALVLIALFMMGITASAQEVSIAGNGTGGIYIDISAAPYSDAWDSRWGQPYGPAGCTWFAAARIEQLTGINLSGIIYGVDQWWNTVYAWYGFSRSSTLNPAYKCVACWYAPNSTPHIAVFEGFTSDGKLIVSEGGRTPYPNNGYCQIHTFDSEQQLISKNSNFLGFIVLPVAATTAGAYLDVNATLDDTYIGDTTGFGTFDVYVGGKKVADDRSDYYVRHPEGSSYTISDIKALGEHTYEGASTYSGTIGASGVNVQLPFYSYGSLEVALSLNGEATTDPVGSFDLYIDGALTHSNLSGHTKSYPKGTTYRIENIKAADGSNYSCSGATGSLSGTIGANAASTVTLNFVSNAVLTGEWQESSYLPGNVTSENCEIQYKHTYTQHATTAPGSDWVQGDLVNTVYENSGGVYDSDFELSTSDTRVYVGSYYYHYCGAGMGTRVEHYQTGQYTDYHAIGDVNMYYVVGEYTDDADSRYHSYAIKWASGQWADGDATCSAGRSSIYYRRYQYQNRVAVNTYAWTRQDADWVTALDDAASSVTYRFRLKDEAQPTIDSVQVTGVSTTGYTISCAVSDDSFIAKVYFETWTDSEGQANAVVKEITPDATAKNWEGSHTVEISDHGNMRDCDYHTSVRVVDGAGNEVSYTGEEATAYIPTLFSSAKCLTMPAGLKVIDAGAFEGDMGIGEVALPEGVKTIGSKAFADCARLVKLQIPDSVTEIAADAFENSSNVVLVCASNNAAAQLARENGWHYVTQQ